MEAESHGLVQYILLGHSDRKSGIRPGRVHSAGPRAHLHAARVRETVHSVVGVGSGRCAGSRPHPLLARAAGWTL